MSLSSPDIEQLQAAELLQCSLDKALRYLGCRPRSQTEIRARLRRSHTPEDVVEQVLAKLKDQKLVDDASFARYWRENRDLFRPRSGRLMKLELRQKGLAQEDIEEAIAGVDDQANAYQAGLKKMSSLGSDQHRFSKALGAFLRRRGFDYETISLTVDRLWREQCDNKQASEDNLRRESR